MNTTKLLRDAIVDQSEKPSFWGSCSGIGYYPPSDVLEYDENSGLCYYLFLILFSLYCFV